MKTVARIRQATIQLVMEYGYDKTTMEDIAREAGVARSTIYTKWKTKEDLFACLLKEEAIRFAKEWYRLVEDDPEGGTFIGIYKNSLLAIQNNPFVKALFTQNRRLLGSFTSQDQLAALMADRLAWTTTLFKMMQAEGMIREDVDAHTAAYLAVVFRKGLLITDFDMKNEQAVSYEEVIDLFTAMFRAFIEESDVSQDPKDGKQMLRVYVEKLLNEYGESISGDFITVT